MSLEENRRIALEREPGTIRECYCGSVIRIVGEQRFEYDGGFGCYVNPVEHRCLTAEVAAIVPTPRRLPELSRDMSRDDVTVSEPDKPSEGFVMPARTHQE